VETIFDHEPTPEELALVFNIRSREDLDRYKRTMARGADTQLGEIARLYLHRGMEDRAAQYLASIRDPGYRFTLELAYLNPDLLAEA
jgi:hypothetical protein